MPVPLTGSAQPVVLGPGYTVRAPGLRGSADLQGAGTTVMPARGLDTGFTALDQALRAADLTEVRRIDISLQPLPGPIAAATRMRGPHGAAELELQVPDPGPDHGQVVLSIDDAGALRWHLSPPAAAGSSAGTARGGGTVRCYRLPATPAPPPAHAGPAIQRSLLGAATRRLLKVLVYPLTDPVLGGLSHLIAQQWEQRKRPHQLRRFTPDGFRRAATATLGRDELAAMAAAGPVLLFIHGTFSTSHAAFGDLPVATLEALHKRYGHRVVAFDHPTLSCDPVANVQWLLPHLPAEGLVLDIVSHSRGGLVARMLAQRLGASAPRPAQAAVRHIVLAGVPNRGTPLADPQHMVNLIDRLTTVLTLAPSGPVAETLEAVVTAVKALGHGALQGLDGLACMHPHSPFLAALNRSGQPPLACRAIASDYEPADGGLRALVAGAADHLADCAFGAAGNDLVVPTEGVDGPNGAAGFPLRAEDVLRFHPADAVTHTALFRQGAVSQRLLGWLTG